MAKKRKMTFRRAMQYASYVIHVTAYYFMCAMIFFAAIVIAYFGHGQCSDFAWITTQIILIAVGLILVCSEDLVPKKENFLTKTRK